ncbi:MAG: hypothetical protein LBK06_04185 [Planctomycetaceae bacterium]|nr:hypothetical protein [Planctomycetaceae bacterium]
MDVETTYRRKNGDILNNKYTEAVSKVGKLNTQSQQCVAVVHGRSLLPCRLRYSTQTTRIEID